MRIKYLELERFYPLWTHFNYSQPNLPVPNDGSFTKHDLFTPTSKVFTTAFPIVTQFAMLELFQLTISRFKEQLIYIPEVL